MPPPACGHSTPAWKPAKLSDIDFEREIRQLQLDGLIDAYAADKYRIRRYFGDPDEEAAQRIVAQRAAEQIDAATVHAVAERILSDDEHRYERERALRVLVRLGEDYALDAIITHISGPDASLALSAAEIVASHVKPAREWRSDSRPRT